MSGALRIFVLGSMVVAGVFVAVRQERGVQAAPARRALCSSPTAIGTVRAYYGAIDRHATARAKACLTSAYLQEMSTVMDPDWENVATVRIVSLKAHAFDVHGLPGLNLILPFQAVQVFGQIRVRYYRIGGSPNGINDRFVYVVKAHRASPWRIMAIGSGP